MVSGQIRTNRVTDERLIEAMEEIPRERFVPHAKRGVAYVDEDVEIASSRYLMEPMVLARLIQESNIAADDMVLDVGCGTGYATAVMSRPRRHRDRAGRRQIARLGGGTHAGRGGR